MKYSIPVPAPHAMSTAVWARKYFAPNRYRATCSNLVHGGSHESEHILSLAIVGKDMGWRGAMLELVVLTSSNLEGTFKPFPGNIMGKLRVWRLGGPSERLPQHHADLMNNRLCSLVIVPC